jgi:hypothetical protein
VTTRGSRRRLPLRRLAPGALVLLSACGKGQERNPTGSPDKELFVTLFAVDSHDMLTLHYAGRVLEHHGIAMRAEGSIGISVQVPAPRALEAEALLRREEGLDGYISWLDGRRPTRPAHAVSDLAIGASLAEARRTHPVTTLPGAILHSERHDRFAASMGVSEVVSVRWFSRPYVTKSFAPTAAVVGTVVFQKKRGDRVSIRESDVILER